METNRTQEANKQQQHPIDINGNQPKTNKHFYQKAAELNKHHQKLKIKRNQRKSIEQKPKKSREIQRNAINR